MPLTTWIYPPLPTQASIDRLTAGLGVAPWVAQLLHRRGFQEVETAGPFLEPRLKTLRDPFLLPGMEAAVARLWKALERRERITLYGDYDVDGVTSLALLARVLRAYGAEVTCFLPSRMEEGYGLSAEGVARCLETSRPQLLVAVDCGTTSVAEVALLAQEGVEAIILDHHVPKGELPGAVALVNPQLGAEFHELCSAGLAFKLAHALLKRHSRAGVDLREYLDLVALGTVADIVPLVGENRILVKRGLRQLEQSRWCGVRALVGVTGVKAPLSPADVGFKLGPRLNAAGRLGTAEAALELLLTDEPARAEMLAGELDRQNQQRRTVEETVFAEAEAQLALGEMGNAIVVGALGWHAGVVGIVASRLARRYHRPALVAGFDEGGAGKGSGRSIAGFSLVAALQACTEHLQKHGGHEMAAGFALPWQKFPAFRATFLAHCAESIHADLLCPRLELEAELFFADLDYALLAQHESLQPFGTGNVQPLFYAREVVPVAEPRVLKEKHLSLRLRQGRTETRAIWFGAAAETLPAPPWEMAFRLERNEYEGRVQPQLEVRALRAMPADQKPG